MALQGTLKDFGIADIFQLIGHQTKTGVLHLVEKDEQVHIAFSNGAIVRADSASRRRRDLLGTMLLNAGMLTQKQLDEALEVQKRTLQRLGDILIAKRFISHAQLKEMFQLQISETVFRLFGWKSGTYEFEQGAVEFDPAIVEPIRSESIIMEGFRRVDEWPAIRKVIASPAMTFVRLAPLPPGLPDAGTPEEDAALDAALGIASGRRPRGEFSSLGPNEKKVFRLAEPNQSVQQIIDLSRLGEFEACKALLNLCNTGKLQPVAPQGKEKGRLGIDARTVRDRVVAAVARLGMTVVVVAVVATLAYLLDVQEASSGAGERSFSDRSAQHLVAGTELRRIDAALAVYRLEKGSFPDGLDQLAQAGLLSASDLRYPFGAPYFYRRDGDRGYVLLPPIE